MSVRLVPVPLAATRSGGALGGALFGARLVLSMMRAKNSFGLLKIASIHELGFQLLFV
jgi:hypothetical protein